MATLSGTEGRVVFSNNYVSHVHAWSMDAVADALEDTNWDWAAEDEGWRSYIFGLKAYTGTYECYAASASFPEFTAANMVACRLRLYLDDNSFFEGYALCTGHHPSAPIDGIQTITIDFQGTLNLGVSSSWSSLSSSSSESSSSASSSSVSVSSSSVSSSASSSSVSSSSVSSSSISSSSVSASSSFSSSESSSSSYGP